MAITKNIVTSEKKVGWKGSYICKLISATPNF